MTDFSQLRAPTHHGEVLIVPEAKNWVQLAGANAHKQLRSAARLLGKTLAEWRSHTRNTVAGEDDRTVIVTGHQPDFFHPGVWAKYVVASRVAAASGAVAINLVVDNDAPKSTVLPIPAVVDGCVSLTSVRYAEIKHGCAFEEIPACSSDDGERFENRVRESLGAQYDSSSMPQFFRGVRALKRPRDWVDQFLAGRRAVETPFGLRVEDRRVSELPVNPLLAEMVLNADRFARIYNRALAGYRQTHRVRSPGRPIPDLDYVDDRIETAWWVYRRRERRRRLFVAGNSESVRLFADADEIGTMNRRELAAGNDIQETLTAWGGWKIRPRALTLTLWARLFLADLFIHGIGGAKYDAVTDRIIADYFDVEPPTYVCVSGTLRMDLPRSGITQDTIRQWRHQRRDTDYNPQRCLSLGGRNHELVQQRAEAILQANWLRDNEPFNHASRRALFRRIRSLNADLAGAHPEAARDLDHRLIKATEWLTHDRVANSREYFFALYDQRLLADWTAALPSESAFRV